MVDHHDHFLTNSEIQVLQILVYVGASLSVLGSGLIVLTYTIFKESRRELGSTLIFFLNLSDLFLSFSWYPWIHVDPRLCELQASAIQFFELSSMFWAFCIAVTLFRMFYSTSEGSKNIMWVFHTLCWGVPCLATFICWRFHLFGSSGSSPWCWITDPVQKMYIYGPCTVIELFNMIIFIIVRIRLKQSPLLTPIKDRLDLFLFAALITQLPGLTNRLQNSLQPRNQIYLLFLLQAATQPLQGFINSIIFGMLDENYLYQYIHHPLFVRYCKCCFLSKSRSRRPTKTSPSTHHNNGEEGPLLHNHDNPVLLEDEYRADHTTPINLNINDLYNESESRTRERDKKTKR
eukprot:TRINITY_DN2177_c0_g1_i1.p1 TRINITY_DN2177_c0_g1~~TRINITY_DN2177_c0_g1_i1.p1  ORF type:complete len:347 (-),score=34.63 TRINITY_DN2177_c0_g1_i1:25-1065(-)